MTDSPGIRQWLEVSPEGERDRTDEKQERNRVVPFDVFAEIQPCKNHEYAECDDLLNDFQLESGELAVADAVCGDLKTIFGEGDQPAHDDGGEQRRLAVFQMAIPGNCHEYIRADKQQDGFHGGQIVSRA